MTIINQQTMQDAFCEIETLRAALAACRRKSEERKAVLQTIKDLLPSGWYYGGLINMDIGTRIHKALED